MKITTWPIDKIDSQGVTRVDECWTYADALKEKRKLEQEALLKAGWQTFTIMRIEN